MKKLLLLACIIMLLSLTLGGCLSDKGKFIGTWQFSEGGTITFFDNDTVTITNIGPLVAVQLTGPFTYTLSGHNLTFTSRASSSLAVTVTFAYSFPDDTTLHLTNNRISVTLTKAS